MSTKLVSLAFVSAFAVACSSSKSVTPTANGVFPSNGFAGRSLRVEISGDATAFTSSSTVMMGSGITVSSVTVASPTDLFADIAIDPTAMLGMRDVTVTSGSTTLTLSQAFEVDTPIELIMQGSTGQGGLPFFSLVNHDAENAFDATTDANGNYVNVMVAGPSGTAFTISSVTDLSVTGRAFIDTTATAGDVMVTQVQGSASLMSDAGTFAIMPRTPIALTNGTPMTGMIADIGDSQLYSLTATGSPAIAHVAMTSTGTMAALAGAMFPDGTWAHAAGLHALLSSPSSIDLVAADQNAYGGYSFTIQGAAETLTAAAAGSDHATLPTALAATAIPFEQTGGMVSAATYMQVISFTVDTAHANKSVELVTDVGSDINTDTAVDIVDSKGNHYLTNYYDPSVGPAPVDGTECGLFGCAPGDNLGEDVVSDALAAGTYYIEITAGASWATTDQSYVAVFWHAD